MLRQHKFKPIHEPLGGIPTQPVSHRRHAHARAELHLALGAVVRARVQEEYGVRVAPRDVLLHQRERVEDVVRGAGAGHDGQEVHDGGRVRWRLRVYGEVALRGVGVAC